MGAAENKETIRNMFADLGRGNAEGYLDRLADDVSFTIIGTTRFSGTFRGKDEVIAKLLGPLMMALEGGIALSPENFVAEGDFVVVQARGKATTKSGKPYDNTYCQVFRLSGGKVKEITEYLDTELVTSAFGR